MDVENDTMSVITQSVFHKNDNHVSDHVSNNNQMASKRIDWDISDDSGSFSDLQNVSL